MEHLEQYPNTVGLYKNVYYNFYTIFYAKINSTVMKQTSLLYTFKPEYILDKFFSFYMHYTGSLKMVSVEIMPEKQHHSLHAITRFDNLYNI